MLVSGNLRSKRSYRDVPGGTRGRCEWVSAVTTERACVRRRSPGRDPSPETSPGPSPPHLFLRGPPRTRPLSLRGPAVLHRARAWPLPAAAHVVEPGAARRPEERTGQAAGRRGRARATQPGQPPARAPTFPLSEGGDTPRASPPRRLPRPLAAALGRHPGHAGQPVWTPLPPLGARGRQRTVSPRAPGRPRSFLFSSLRAPELWAPRSRRRGHPSLALK